jgi:hypothetical protein
LRKYFQLTMCKFMPVCFRSREKNLFFLFHPFPPRIRHRREENLRIIYSRF